MPACERMKHSISCRWTTYDQLDIICLVAVRDDHLLALKKSRATTVNKKPDQISLHSVFRCKGVILSQEKWV